MCLKEDIDHLLTVIIPTLNEAEAIQKVIQELREQNINNIIVVDGRSTDGTPELARKMGVKVIFQEGKGKADAIRTVLKYVNTKYVLIMDGDYTYPAKYVRPLLAKIQAKDYDEVIGARRLNKHNSSIIFRIGNKLLTFFFNLLFGTHLSDVLSGMYVVRTERLKEMIWETRGFSIESEIVAHIASQTGKVDEIPIEYRKRLGKKKLGVFHGFLIARDMVRLAWRYNPSFFIFLLGSLLLIPGVILAGWVAFHYFIYGVKYYVKGILSLIMVTSGFLSLILAILALFLKRIEYRINHQLQQIRELLKER